MSSPSRRSRKPGRTGCWPRRSRTPETWCWYARRAMGRSTRWRWASPSPTWALRVRIRQTRSGECRCRSSRRAIRTKRMRALLWLRCASLRRTRIRSMSTATRPSSASIGSPWSMVRCSSTTRSAAARPARTSTLSTLPARTPSRSRTTSWSSAPSSSTPATSTRSRWSSSTTRASARPRGLSACSTTRTTATGSWPMRWRPFCRIAT